MTSLPSKECAVEAGSGWLVEEARVLALFDGGAWVETDAEKGCGGCSARHGCGSRLLSSRRSAPRLALYTDETLRVGDRIRIGLPAARFLQGALIVYGGPLLTAILAGGLAEWLTAPGSNSVPLAFVAGLALGVLGSRHALRIRQRRYLPRLIATPRAAATFLPDR